MLLYYRFLPFSVALMGVGRNSVLFKKDRSRLYKRMFVLLFFAVVFFSRFFFQISYLRNYSRTYQREMLEVQIISNQLPTDNFCLIGLFISITM